MERGRLGCSMVDKQDEPSIGAELVAVSRSPGSDATVEELHRQHREPVLSYAYTCCHDPQGAEDLTSEVFAHALRAARSGNSPTLAWRPYLLAVVRRTAAGWAGTDRRAELSPDFREWLTTSLGGLAGSDAEPESIRERMLRLEDDSPVLRAFRSLPERWQAVLWHTEVERDAASSVGRLLGVDENGVDPLVSRAAQGLRHAYLATHEENSPTDECRRYGPMLGAVARRAGRRTTEDLGRHLSQCYDCRQALVELTAIDEQLRFILPVGVLLWAGAAYAGSRMVEACQSAADGTAPPAAPADRIVVDDAGDRWPWAPGSRLRSGVIAGGIVTAVGLAILILLMVLQGQDEAPSASRVEAEWTPPGFVAPAPTVSPTLQPSPTASSRRATPPPVASATASSRPGAALRPPLGPVTWSGALRNAGVTAQCVEPDGTAVVQNPCNGSRTQVWQAVSFKEKPGCSRLRNAASGECIDYHRGVRRLQDNAVHIAVVMGPCRAKGEGQLFRIAPHSAAAGDNSFLLRAELAAGKPWHEMHLGMLDWWDGAGSSPPPKKGAPVVLTYNYYDAVRLRYLLDGRAPAPDASSYTAVNSAE
ncbi:sigma factor [Streptomyces lunaelactis]|uniref:sigma factor n=1 Tax=Streptomyces lunaelactis TaxID=1535768 RepID=UPI001585CCDD|nr:sigma factor [Streptomyces lunaelactis]NUK56911.1 hypothetical protein [Streptomyces lunaelactis]